MEVLYQIGIIGLCSWLFYRGGQKGGKLFRRIIIPLILGLYFAIKCKWWMFFAIGLGLQTIGIGWGNYEIGENNSFLANITKDKDGWWVRAIWGLLVGCGGLFGAFLGGYITLFTYLSYILILSAICFTVSRLRLKVLLADLIVGFFISIIIYL